MPTPVITVRNYHIYIPNRNRWIQVGMSSTPAEYRVAKGRINVNALMFLYEDTRNGTSRDFFSVSMSVEDSKVGRRHWTTNFIELKRIARNSYQMLPPPLGRRYLASRHLFTVFFRYRKTEVLKYHLKLFINSL